MKDSGFHSGSISGIKEDAASGRKSWNESGIKRIFGREKLTSPNKQKLSGILGNFDNRRRDNQQGSLENTKLLYPKTDTFRIAAFQETPISSSLRPTASIGLKVLSKVHLLLHNKNSTHKSSLTDGKKSFRSNAAPDVTGNLQPHLSPKHYHIDEYDTRDKLAADTRQASSTLVQMDAQRGRSKNHLSESSTNLDREPRSPKERSDSSFHQSQLYLRSHHPKRSVLKEETENLTASLGDLVARLKAMIEARDSTIHMLQSQNLSLRHRLEHKSQEAEYLKVRLSIIHNN